MAQTVVCPHCTGKVGHLRGQTLEDALDRHLRMGCPSPMVKRPASVSAPPAKRVRMIPRADPPKSRKR